MKTLHYLLIASVALFAFVSCADKDVPYIPKETEYDEAWYAANATISSSDAHFAVTEEGNGAISFKAEGGSVVVHVDCGTEWTAENSASDIFGCDVQSASITVTADQNLAEEELYGTITLMTLPSQIHFATITVTQNAYGAPEITVSTNEWKIPAVTATAEELTTEIGVEATGEWSIENDAEWLTVEKGGDEENSVILTAAENETTEERVAEVVLTCTDGYNSDSETIAVTQDARAYITLSEEEFEPSAYGGKATVSVESNYDWEYDTNGADWLTVTDNGDNSIAIACSDNDTGSGRETSVTFTAGDGVANTAVASLTIAQGIKNPDDLVLEYTVDIDGRVIELPMYHYPDIGSEYYEIDCTVDWGDGSEVEAFDTNYPSHTYSKEGTYFVIINGTVEHLCYRGGSFNTDGARKCLTAVKQWGNTGLKSMEYAFVNCTNLTSLPEGPGPFENVTSFEDAFSYCTSLEELPEDIFKNCTECTIFRWAFNGCNSLISAPSFKGLSKVTNFFDVFFDCTSLTNLPENMFSGCTEVASFEGAFIRCTSLKTVPVNIFSDCTKVTDFSTTFMSCSSVEVESPYTEIDVDGTLVKVHLYERENYPDYFTAPTYHNTCFYLSTFSDMDSIPSNWGGNGN